MARFSVSSAILMALAIPTAQAFTSSVPFTKSSFVPSHSGFVSVRTSDTALSMNLFDRFSRVAKSNLNNILKNLEDPEKIMGQALEDMQSDLVKVRQSYAEVTATQRRLLKQKEQADALAQDWFKRAQLALEKGNEDLAREALSRKQQQTEEADSLQMQIDAQAASIDKLYEGMQMLEKKVLESKAKKEQMVARARTAQSTQKVNDMLGGLTGSTSMDAFTRMEEKVEALEASAEVSAEMGAVGGMALPGSSGSSLENEFKKLEAASSVDDELSKMKGLLKGSSDDSASKPSSSSAKSSNPEVDDELAKLKKDAGL
ncbi:Membrane-associated 30 kDa protein, chloroplastic [Seminavis robusta]|uniref:Membrane-associated 30 kDa protein, chloroplastic n=1 Tax=Seminavis robusta TaxID=568900 RepID=A0A9N8EFX1_9STRA|nr:Membrane-associated 30 kDa protein, chloroplastic [Seminavis robusta]|eukprot:Sro1136_g245180.1 Membrane-associated 30 kDa protein, chloroplastic (316) ;mRNA; f:19366-20610